jgi:hypothetical protein
VISLAHAINKLNIIYHDRWSSYVFFEANEDFEETTFGIDFATASQYAEWLKLQNEDKFVPFFLTIMNIDCCFNIFAVPFFLSLRLSKLISLKKWASTISLS